MKMQHLRFFAAVVDEGGVLKAAERLHLSQPAISAGLKALERDLGQSLFDRSGKRLRLTPQGARFHRRALEILRECDAARAELLSPEPASRRLRFGVLETISATDIQAALGVLRRERPEAAVEVWEGQPARLSGWLSQGRIDLALTLVDEDEAAAPGRLLYREPFVVMAAPSHHLARRGIGIALRDLAGEPFVLRTRCEMGALAKACLRAAGVVLNVIARIERDEIAMRLVAQGMGLTLSPQGLARPDTIALPVADLALARPIGLRWHGTVPAGVPAALAQALSPAGTNAGAALAG